MAKIIAYTDGACIPNPGVGGWGYVIYITSPEWTVRLRLSDNGGSKYSTNQQMEARAMAELLESLPPGETVDIYSDSCYVLGGIVGKVKVLTLAHTPLQGRLNYLVGQPRRLKSKSTQDTQDSYDPSYWKDPELSNGEDWWRIHKALMVHAKHGSKLYFCWVKGHSKNEGNDFADELAGLYIKEHPKFDPFDKPKSEIVKSGPPKFYAVKIGRIPGIYGSWDECLKQTSGFPSAKHKKFNTESEALLFIK